MVFTLHDFICVCPNYMMLSNGKVCEKCIHGQFYHCFLDKCVKNSHFKSFLATIEAYNYKRMNVYNRIDAYITPSLFYEKKLKQLFTNCPIIHMRNPLPYGTEYGIKKERKDYALYFGRISKEKGIETMIKAMQYTKENKPLWIVGEGPMKTECKKLVKASSLSSRVLFLGYESGQVLENIVRQAKCVILASEGYENGPYAIAEAMAYGTPVIVSNSGGLPEVVEDGVTGLICEPGNALDLASKLDVVYDLNDKAYNNMCKKAYEKASELFNPDTYYLKISALYANLLRAND